MIELIEGSISSKKAPKEPVSFSYEKGQVNYITFEERYKFDFLMLKNQALDSGTFKISDKVIYPNEENEQSLFFLTVNSLIKLHLCFLAEAKSKKEKVKFVQEELIKLRDLPIETEEDKDQKAIAIFNKVVELQPDYVLLDLNDEVNSKEEFIKNELEKHKDELLFVVLDKKPIVIKEDSQETKQEDFEFDAMDLAIGSDAQLIQETKKEKIKKERKPRKEVKDSKGFWNTFVAVFKENYMAFLSFIVPSLGVIAFVLLSPLYAQTNAVLLIPFIITITVCFVLFMLMTYKCSEFENRNQLIAFAIMNVGSVLTAYGLSIGIYFLFLNFDAEIKALQSKNLVGFIVSIVMALILMTACLYLKVVVDKIKGLFKKK